ncbi:MAG: hypothetical protein IKA09_11710 [Lachnospiraceae bacterium]|nr:hypothetical protein [Lachnospiraceae bacterium]
MKYKIAVYGLTDDQEVLLEAALPEDYELTAAECATDLIVTNAVCTVIDAANIGEDALRTLLAYYMDVGDRLDETVVWLCSIEVPDLPCFVRCDSFLELLTELESILTRAQIRYDTMQMYGDEYGYLPKHAIEESIEADVNTALHRKCGRNPDPLIVKRMRQEFQVVLEAGAAEELAAVYELIRWLKNSKYSFNTECSTAFPLILYLLDIADSASQIDLDRNPLLQKDRLNPHFAFYLHNELQVKIKEWQSHHWLCNIKGNTSIAFERIEFIFN